MFDSVTIEKQVPRISTLCDEPGCRRPAGMRIHASARPTSQSRNMCYLHYQYCVADFIALLSPHLYG